MKSLMARSIATIGLTSNTCAMARSLAHQIESPEAAPTECLRVYPGLAGDTTRQDFCLLAGAKRPIFWRATERRKTARARFHTGRSSMSGGGVGLPSVDSKR